VYGSILQFVCYYNNQFLNIYMHSITTILFYGDIVINLGHVVAYCLRHYAASRRVVGSRPDEVGFF
jgi:hypothetical protein